MATAEIPRPLNGVVVKTAMSGEGDLSLQVRRGVVLTAVQQRGVSSWTLLSFAAVAFMARTVMLMLGPLLVILANDFGTSIAMAGQLAAATFVAWGITAPLVGPISDTYGRKPVLLIGVLLMALGVLGSGAAWSYGSLLATRLIAGAGTAMLPMTMMAALADNLPPEKVGKAVGFITASSWVGLALGWECRRSPCLAISAVGDCPFISPEVCRWPFGFRCTCAYPRANGAWARA